ncbi:hypothetical protein OUZ56_031143 [Daphnia magna]|uniref:Uncharacterized protein n=1 Tax=Daphnia magna TaxID=35525 RepID=A0ABQ9ZTD7_9CRUS|nr:hypothetical protein OUZ56_031143 [Daphnia magna]
MQKALGLLIIVDLDVMGAWKSNAIHSPDNENGFEPEKGSTQLEMTFKTFSSTDNDLHLKFRKGKTKANK